MDVKLANIVYGNDKKLKLIDFGYSIFYNKEENLKKHIKYVPSNSFWVMSLEQFKIFFKQFEIEIKEKCNKKIEKEIQDKNLLHNISLVMIKNLFHISTKKMKALIFLTK